MTEVRESSREIDSNSIHGFDSSFVRFAPLGVYGNDEGASYDCTLRGEMTSSTIALNLRQADTFRGSFGEPSPLRLSAST